MLDLQAKKNQLTQQRQSVTDALDSQSQALQQQAATEVAALQSQAQVQYAGIDAQLSLLDELIADQASELVAPEPVASVDVPVEQSTEQPVQE